MDIWLLENYRAVLQHGIEGRKKIDPKTTYQAAATAGRVPKSYLSKVLHGGAHLSSDQFFRIAEYCGLRDEERQFGMLLLEWERSVVKERQKTLNAEIEAMRREYMQSKHYLPVQMVGGQTDLSAKYFLDPFYQIIHMALSIARYAKNFPLLAKDLSIPLPKVHKAVRDLVAWRMVEVDERGSYRILVDHLHLERSSDTFRAWSRQLKILSAARMEDFNPEAFSFSAVFSAPRSCEAAVRQILLGAVRQVEKLVKDQEGKEEEVFQLSLDFFPWTRSWT